MHGRNIRFYGAWRHVFSSHSWNTRRLRQCPTTTSTTPFHSSAAVLDEGEPSQVKSRLANRETSPSIRRISQDPGHGPPIRQSFVRRDRDARETRDSGERRHDAMWKDHVRQTLHQDTKVRDWKKGKHAQPNGPQDQTKRPPTHVKGENDREMIDHLYTYLRRDAEKNNLQSVELIIERLIQQHGRVPDAAMYIPLIRANANAPGGSAARIAQLLDEAEVMKVQKSSSLYSSALKALAIHPDPLLRGKLLDEMRERWFDLSAEDWHYVVAGYIREGQLEQGQLRLEQMREQGVPVAPWLNELLIISLLSTHELDEAHSVLRELFETKPESLRPTIWYTVLDAACETLHLGLTRFVWTNRVIPGKLNPSTGHCEQILQAAAHAGDTELGIDVFRHLRTRAAVLQPHHYELLIATYAANDDLDTALRISCLMGEAGMPLASSALWPLKSTFLKNVEAARRAMGILRGMAAERRVPVDLVNVLVEACVELRRLDDAVEMLRLVPGVCDKGPNINTFNALLRGCYLERRKGEALALFGEMDGYGVRADALTYEWLVQVCLAGDDLDGALRYYSEMESKRFVLSKDAFISLILRAASKGEHRTEELLAAMQKARHETSEVERQVQNIQISGNKGEAALS